MHEPSERGSIFVEVLHLEGHFAAAAVLGPVTPSTFHAVTRPVVVVERALSYDKVFKIVQQYLK